MTQIVSGPSFLVAYGSYASTDNIKLLESWRNYFIFGVGAPVIHTTRWAVLGSPDVYLLKARVLGQ